MSDMSYEAWRSYIFDREASEDGDAWYWGDLEPLKILPQQAAQYAARLFLESGKVLADFSDAHVARGLEYMVNIIVSDHGQFFHDGKLPQIDRIESMAILFRDVFAVRCPDILSHVNEAGGRLLNGICYMWWDVIPLTGEAGGHRPNPIDEACLSVMDAGLNLSNPACQESALHASAIGRAPIRSLPQASSMPILRVIRTCGRNSRPMPWRHVRAASNRYESHRT